MPNSHNRHTARVNPAQEPHARPHLIYSHNPGSVQSARRPSLRARHLWTPTAGADQGLPGTDQGPGAKGDPLD